MDLRDWKNTPVGKIDSNLLGQECNKLRSRLGKIHNQTAAILVSFFAFAALFVTAIAFPLSPASPVSGNLLLIAVGGMVVAGILGAWIQQSHGSLKVELAERLQIVQMVESAKRHDQYVRKHGLRRPEATYAEKDWSSWLPEYSEQAAWLAGAARELSSGDRVYSFSWTSAPESWRRLCGIGYDGIAIERDGRIVADHVTSRVKN